MFQRNNIPFTTAGYFGAYNLSRTFVPSIIYITSSVILEHTIYPEHLGFQLFILHLLDILEHTIYPEHLYFQLFILHLLVIFEHTIVREG